MASGLHALEKLRYETKNLPAGSEYWVDLLAKLDLCKLRVRDLNAADFDSEKAEGIVASLNHQDLAPLGDALGIRLRVNFRVWAERDGFVCALKSEGGENAEWLRSYLRSKLPNLKVTEPEKINDSSLYRFDVICSEQLPPWRVQKVLLECPAITLVRTLSVRIVERPHYIVQAYNLAAWIEDQGEETWWRVDGDPLLMSKIEFPCPPDELAGALREINRPLLVSDPEEAGWGEEVVPEELTRLVDANELGVRTLYLSWKDEADDWLLIENEPTSGTSIGG